VHLGSKGSLAPFVKGNVVIGERSAVRIETFAEVPIHR
jgi:hypothetical protein